MALIKNTTELKAHLGSIQKNINYATMLPFIEQSEIKYIIPYIGSTFFADVDTLHNSGSPTSQQIELIKRLSRALAYYSYLEALPMLNIHMGDIGIVQQSDSEGTSTPASGWSYHKAEHQASTNADRFLDYALEYLEENIDHTDFATFKASDTWSEYNDLLISKATDFDKHVSIGKSRRTFTLLKPHIRRVERQIVSSEISKDLYDELITEKKAGTLTSENNALIAKLQPAIAALSMFESLPYLSVQISGNGIHVINENENVRQKLQASTTDKSLLQEKLFESGKSEMNGVVRFLYDNPDDYPTFTASSTYVPANDPKPYEKLSQANKKSFFS
jgi:hypothetical protein